MSNTSAASHARKAATNAAMVPGLIGSSQTERAIAQSLYELAKAIEEIAKSQD